MNVNYFDSKPNEVDFNLSNYKTKIEVRNKIEELFTKNIKGKYSFLLTPPIAKELSIPDAMKVVGKYNSLDIDIDVYLLNKKSIELMQRLFRSSEILITSKIVNGLELIIATGDISEYKSETIVNASNTFLSLGSGVSGAIRQKAGDGLQIEMTSIAKNNEVKNGDAFITGSYGMRNTQSIIHSVCVEGSKNTISLSINNVLKLCNEKGIETVAFPALGTGVGNMKIEVFAKIFFDLINNYAIQKNKSLKKISLVLWSKKDYQTVLSIL